MRIYAIRDNTIDRKKNLAFFFYYEHINECCIEINDGISEWELPFILDSYVRRGIMTVTQEDTMRFISQRVIPPDRQNIGMILKDNGLDEYDEIKLFILSDGRCAQDECFIRPIADDELPENIRSRLTHRITAFLECDNRDFLVSFADGSIGVIERQDFDLRIGKKYGEKIFREIDIEISGGGSQVNLKNYGRLSSDLLYTLRRVLPFSLSDMGLLYRENYLKTSDVCQILECTRQNVNDLVKRGKLQPIEEQEGGLIFRRTDVMERM